VALDRLIPIAYIPFWDRDAALKELVRCKEAGHRGFMMTQNPAVFGAPGLANPHWDPVWAAAEDMGMPVNFHIGSGDNSLHARTWTARSAPMLRAGRSRWPPSWPTPIRSPP
jgi:uncharacterized protein